MLMLLFEFRCKTIESGLSEGIWKGGPESMLGRARKKQLWLSPTEGQAFYKSLA